MKYRFFMGLLAISLATPALAEVPRHACDWLRLASPEDLLGGPLTYEPRGEKNTPEVAFSVCAVDGPGGALSLLRREVFGAVPPIAELTAGYTADLAETIGTEPQLQMLDLGAAALYDPTMHQLAVWSHDGHVMTILSMIGKDAGAQMQELATRLLAAGN
jgi:hypothetical protein